MTPILFIASGFILGILWVDLKFDWLAVPHRDKSGLLPTEAMTPMVYFYRYVTGKPIVMMTAILMIVTTLILEISQGLVPAWVTWLSLLFFGIGAGSGVTWVIPTARRFGRDTDSPEKQTKVAHALLGMHSLVFFSVLLMTLVQLYVVSGTKISMFFFVCIGYIISIGWLNVKFDWVAMPYRGKPDVLPEELVAPIALFHRYLNSAIEMGVAIIFILVTLIFEVAQGLLPNWIVWPSLILFVIGMYIPMALIRSARRLGERTDAVEKQTSLAHGLLPGSVIGLIIILLIGVLQAYGMWIS